MSSFSQEQLAAIAFEKMAAIISADPSADLIAETAKKMQADYVLRNEEAEAAAKAAFDKWTDVYFPD